MTTKISVTREVITSEVISEVSVDELISRLADALHIHVCGRTAVPEFDLFTAHDEIATTLVKAVLKL